MFTRFKQSFLQDFKGMVTNGLGIVRDIAFYDERFLADHPEIPVGKKSDSPDEDKSLADSKALIPTLKDFLQTILSSALTSSWAIRPSMQLTSMQDF